MRSRMISALAVGCVACLSAACSQTSPSPTVPVAPANPGTRAVLPPVPSFSWLSANVFTPRCVRCHNGSNSSAGVDLSSYAAIQNSPATHGDAIVQPGNPDGSRLYTSVSSGAMPPDATKLTSAELDALRAWIQNGALNN